MRPRPSKCNVSLAYLRFRQVKYQIQWRSILLIRPSFLSESIMGDPAVLDPAKSSSSSTNGSKPASGGLKDCWNLKDAPSLDESGASEQAKKFLTDFKSIMATANTSLQYTACNAEKAKHDPYVTERDEQYVKCQDALKKIGSDESKAKSEIEAVLNGARTFAAKAAQFKQAAEKSLNEWKKREPDFDKAVHQVEELEAWGDPKASELRESSKAILTATNDRKYDNAVQMLAEFELKLKPVHDEYLRQKAAKEKYEPALKALQPRLDQALAPCPFKTLQPKSTEIATDKKQMETDAQNKDYVHALELVTGLSGKVDAYEAAIKQLEEKKKKYEDSLGILKPKLPTQSAADFPQLGPLEIDLFNLERQAKEAADAEDYDKANEHLKSLETKLNEYETKKQELEKKKAEYEQLAKEIAERLPTQSAADYPQLNPLQIELTTLNGQMKASADAKDWEKGIEHANNLKTKLDEYETKKQELEKKKAEYDAARKALEPKLPQGCPVNTDLADKHGKIMADKGEMDKAAESKDYDTALKKAKELEPKLTEYEKQQALIASMKMESETISTKPSNRKRTKLGVGEEVKLTITPAALSPIKWSVTGDGKLSSTSGSSVTFTAHETASKPKITAEYAGTKVDVEFEVIAPTGITFARIASLNGSFPAGQAGTGMHLSVTFNPADVSFYRTQWLEVPGPATNVNGFFAQNPPFTAASLFHNPNPSGIPINPDNKLAGFDVSSYAIAIPNGIPPFPTWSNGGWTWVIPNRYIVVGGNAAGHLFTNTTQIFSITATGGTTVTKQGMGPVASISRNP